MMSVQQGEHPCEVCGARPGELHGVIEITTDKPTCFNLFHSQVCHGFGVPEYCPECGGSWTWTDRERQEESCPDCGYTGPYDGHVCEDTQC